MPLRFEEVVCRVVVERARRGELDAALLDGACIVLGRGALGPLLEALEPLLPGLGLPGQRLAGLDRETDSRAAARALTSLSEAPAALLVAEHLERARRSLDRLETLTGIQDQEAALEVEALVSDLVAGRGVL